MTRRDLFFLPAVAAPEFRGRTLAQANFTKSGLRGKVVLIQFWATWCGFCRRDQEALDEVYMDFASRGLEVLAVNVREPERKVRAYLRERPRVVPVALSSETDLLDRFPAAGFPTYVLLNKDGYVAALNKGAQGRDGLLRMLKQAGLT